jgi:hypothetical protein
MTSININSTSISRRIFIADINSSNGAGLTGLTWNTAGLTVNLITDDLSVPINIPLVNLTSLTSWLSGGFKEIDPVLMPGWYVYCIPDTAFDYAGSCDIIIFGAANMAVVNLHIDVESTIPNIQNNSSVLLNRIVGTLTSGNHFPQSGDTFSRLGAPIAASISQDIQTRLPTSGYITPPSAVSISNQINTDLSNSHGSGSWLNNDDNSIRNAIGLASGNIDTQFTTITSKTNNLPSSFPANFASLGINSSGHINRVTLVDNVSNGGSSGSPSAIIVIPANSIPQISGTNITVFKGTTWNINVSGVGNNATDFYFTLKSHGGSSDLNSAIQLNTSGLVYFNNSLQNDNTSKITYSSNNSGTLNIYIKPELTSQISPVKYYWDIKAIDSETSIVSFGSWHVKEDITNRYE